ncbi:MAG: S-methyl-5'-thioinosine phosphorylase [Proteobacteria bacterium]|nr:S-methyl-5'-thioinosine phosphorylase [Pseudomonadota bacterium]MDE3208773.1 S-methyl-5'-thioinosine phosphorylase [Pseudomonadota bacterium]
MLAILGGTGLTNLANLTITHRQVIRTPYGEPSGALLFGNIAGHEVMFMARHGYGHTIPPHLVNYRANLWALSSQKATHVISVSAVGSIDSNLAPGTLVIPDQLIDYTSNREHTYFDTPDHRVTHMDFTEPFSHVLRAICTAAAKKSSIDVKLGGVYAVTQGPRLDTAAEVKRYQGDGASMVGMTGMPEAALARELGLEYLTLAVVSNYAAGCAGNLHRIEGQEVYATLERAMYLVRGFLEQVVICFHD